MALNWWDIDVRARELYSKLIEAKSEGYSWDDTWVRVKRRDLPNIQYCYDHRWDYLWTGLEWVECFTYEAGDKTYVRLPQRDEIA